MRPVRALRATTESVVGAAGLWYALPVPTYSRPERVSIAGVVHTAPPSRPRGTMYVLQSRRPVRALSATTAPRVLTLGSLVSPYRDDTPMYTRPRHATGLP